MLTKADIKLIKSLSGKASRTESGLFVVEGTKMVTEAISSNFTVSRIFATDDFYTPKTEVEHVSPKDMERISHLKTPTNALALVELPTYRFSATNATNELIIALDDIQDPGNIGTIIRIADWFGIKHIICSPATADCFNPKVVQATMGALFRVQIHYTDLEPILTELSAKGAPIYGTFLEGENIYDSPLSPNGVILMGNEGHGISAALSKQVTNRIFIPPYPANRQGSESLNVAVATAITCAEFRHSATGTRKCLQRQ